MRLCDKQSVDILVFWFQLDTAMYFEQHEFLIVCGFQMLRSYA